MEEKPLKIVCCAICFLVLDGDKNKKCTSCGHEVLINIGDEGIDDDESGIDMEGLVL